MAAPHDPPAPAEIVLAVREWIERDVMPATSGRLQFHALVAARMLAIAERELELGPAHAAAHAARLDSFGCRDDRELASRIRSGALDDRYEDVRAALEATVRDKLAVANPGYLDQR